MSSTIEARLEWVETVENLRLPPKADQRLQELMDRNNEGLLTDAERADLESLVELSERLSLLRRKRFTCWSRIVASLSLGISRCSEILTAGYFANHSLVVHSQLPDQS